MWSWEYGGERGELVHLHCDTVGNERASEESPFLG